MEERRPRSGERYRNLKDKLYQVVAVAMHSETQEELVIYQALHEDFTVYAKPLSLFISEMKIDSFKKENSIKKEAPALKEDKVLEKETVSLLEETLPERTQILLEFLNYDSYEEKLEYLRDRKKYIDDRMLNDISFALDIVIEEGELEDRIRTLENCLKTFCRYEGTRLR